MDVCGVTVLLVGSSARTSSTLERYLRKRGCDICFATSRKEALAMLQRCRFDLVLSEFMLADGTAYQLIPPLRGTDTTMFFSNAVEEGCWWMTAVFNGQDRSEEPGMRRAEFRIRLNEILYDKFLRSTNDHTVGPADRCKDVLSGFGDQTADSVRSHLRPPEANRASGANGHAES